MNVIIFELTGDVERMLKQLIENHITMHCESHFFQPNIYELKNCIEVLGIEATALRMDNDQIAAGYVVDNRIFFKSMRYGQTTITLTDGQREAIVQLYVRPSGEIMLEVMPNLEDAEIVLVYYRTILAETAIAIDLIGALKHYLVAHNLMNDEDAITEVHYKSMHPNVLKDSYAGNFVLGCRPDGEPLTNAEEFDLANRLATLEFSKIIIQQDGIQKMICLRMLLTFMITDYVIVS